MTAWPLWNYLSMKFAPLSWPVTPPMGTAIKLGQVTFLIESKFKGQGANSRDR